MVRCLVAALLVCLAPVVRAQDLPVLPADDHAAWQAIGRINTAGYRTRDMCTGALIAPDTVLTAAHCVSGVDGLGPRPEDITFVAGWMRGTAADSVDGASIWVHPRAYADGTLDIRYDVALLTLARPSTVAPLRVDRDAAGPPFAVIGYSNRRPHMLSASFTCTGRFASALLRLDCPVLPGNSGGPVMARAGAEWTVTAVISAMGQPGALAVPVSRLLSR